MVWRRHCVLGAFLACLVSFTTAAAKQPYRADRATLEEPRRLTYFESCGSLLDPARSQPDETIQLCSVVRSVAYDDAGYDAAVIPESNTIWVDDCNAGCCDTSNCCTSGCCTNAGGLLSNWEFFFAGDGWKTKGDDDDNNNFGFRMGFNTSIGLGSLPARFQSGFSFGGYDFFGREDMPEQNGERQFFLTNGFYQRSNVCCGNRISAGFVWDYMHDNAWGEEASRVDLHQFRSQVGYAINQCTEIGAWGAFRVGEDHFTSSAIGPTATLTAMSQASAYIKRNWEFGGDTMVYIGCAEEPGELVLGFNGRVPLSHRVAAFGGVHYAVPSTTAGDTAPNGVGNSYSEETWAVAFGLVYYPGAKARSKNISGPSNLPLMPVADNGSFMVSAPTGSL